MKYLLNAVLLSIFTVTSLYASVQKTAVPTVKRKPILIVEYEYSRSGRITARKINGQVQNYKYDKKGQLLGVYDDKGNAIEEYVYDPAGNILKKMVQGKTTTYQYDKANQLVSSECNGKVTKYEYDAAGRLVKEGDRVYSYIGLDKIESVMENGRKLSSFSYHIDGQLAEAMTPEKRETFQWDGLALIQRNITSYVNEPAVTGGNPILADDKVLFNDMLGTTLGVKDDTKTTQNSLTAFGEPLNSSHLKENSFFTGKPHVGEMGYVFLFRNYRADQGKWQTSDPLGYPDGWNNFVYVNNDIINNIDWLGAATRGIHGRSLAGVAGILPYQHSWTSLTLTAAEYSALDSQFKTGAYANAWTQEPNGNMTTKVSAYEEDGKLVKKLNDPRDTNSQGLDFYDDLTLKEIESILNNFDDYNNNADYSGLSQNCNTFTNTINNNNLPASMADPDIIQLFIGIEKTLNGKYFE